MRKNKMIAKGCPKCEQQVPVARKACPCGHSFFNARKTSKALSHGVDIRRTQRVRREKPNYYDSSEYEKQLRKTKPRHSECENDDELGRKENGKNKRRKIKKEEDDEEDVINLSPEKQIQCTLILEEINQRIQVVHWKPS